MARGCSRCQIVLWHSGPANHREKLKHGALQRQASRGPAIAYPLGGRPFLAVAKAAVPSSCENVMRQIRLALPLALDGAVDLADGTPSWVEVKRLYIRLVHASCHL